MPTASEILSGVHLLLLFAFVGATSVAMLVAVLSRLRIPRTLLVWRPGPLTSFPLGPSLFLLAVGSGFGVASAYDVSIAPHVLIGYPAGGLFWGVATWLTRSVVITDYGLVPDIHRLQRAVVWGQVVDYFVTERDAMTHYVFFYRDAHQQHRLDLPVPDAHAEAFRRVVESKVDARFALSEEAAHDSVSSDQ